MNKDVNPEEKLCRARTQLILNQPFFGTLCLRLKLVAMPSFPTMATDGRRLAYNPAFVAQLRLQNSKAARSGWWSRPR
jgi:hypothetical protein